MSLVERHYYPLDKAAKKLCCDEDDLIHFGAIGELEICAFIDGSFMDYSIETKLDLVHHEELATIRDTGMYCSFAAVHLNDLPSKLHISGLMSLSPEILRYMEFYGDDGEFDFISVCTPYKNNEITSFFMINEIGMSVTKDRLYITADEISNIINGEDGNHNNKNHKEKFLISEDSPKTTAKASEIILSLLKMIPELSSVNFEKEKVAKIVNIIESVAACKGVEIPKTHWQTWQKYLAR